MATLLELKTISSDKGNLTVFEKIIPGNIKRLFYIYGVKDERRGGHRHKESISALTCVSGSCKIYVHDGKAQETYLLDSPEQCLVLEAADWREMYDFSENAVLLVMSNVFYDEADYIYEKYEEQFPNELIIA